MTGDLLKQPNTFGAPGFVVSVADDYAPGSRGGSWSVDDGGSRKYRNRLKIQTSSRFVGTVAILEALPVRLGDIYTFPVAAFPYGVTENDTGSFLQAIELEQSTEDGQQWLARLTYDHFDVAHQLGNSMVHLGVFNPLEQVATVEWDQAKYERYKPYDESGKWQVTDTGDTTLKAPKAYVNTAGDPLENPPRTEETRPILRFARAEPIYNDAYASSFKDTVCSDEFLGYAPGTVKCRDIRAERRYVADWGYYWWVQYEFEFRDDVDLQGYTEQILNAGYRAYATAYTGPPKDVLINGSKVSAPVPLQEDGTYKALSTPAADGSLPASPVLPHYLPFQLFPQVAFADLNIPDDLLDAAT
jgi:hypothetical protein